MSHHHSEHNFAHAIICSFLATAFLFFLHHLPVNQIFIDPFSEAIKNHDIMDVALSKFRNHNDPTLFDEDVFIINSEITDRKKIAKAVQLLHQKGAIGIGVDLLFSTSTDTLADSLLMAAFNHPNVVLGYTFKEDVGHVSLSLEYTDSMFTKTASRGYVNLGSNDGFSVRTFEPFHHVDNTQDTSFAVKLATMKDASIYTTLGERSNKKEWINFRRKQTGRPNMGFPVNSEGISYYPTVNISDFLDNLDTYDSTYFQNKIVIIGFLGENDQALSMKDRYFTPLNEKYSGRSVPDMHGVLVHANIVSMLLDNDYIYDINEKLLYGVAFLVYFINYLIFNRIIKRKLFFTVATVRLIQVLQFIVLFTISVYLMTYHNVKYSFVLIITAVILSFELYEFYHNRIQHRIEKSIASFTIKKNLKK